MTSKIETKLRIKCGWPILMYSWTTIKHIIVFLEALDLLCAALCFVLFYFAVRTKLEVGDYLNMVTDNDGVVLPVILGISGVVCLPINMTIAFLLYRTTSRKPKKVINKLLFTSVIIILAICIMLFAVAILALTHSNSIQASIEDGILDAMKQYKVDPEKKYSIDILQMQFDCCGSKNFTEWFEIPWFDTDLAGVDALEEGDTRDDAPFSCCSSESLYPCIHHDVMSVGKAYVYNPESNVSLSRRGCHGTLLKETKLVAFRVSATLFGFSAMQFMVFIGTRLIQTAHSEKYKFYRNSFWHTSWIIGCYKNKKSKRPPKVPPIPEELLD